MRLRMETRAWSLGSLMALAIVLVAALGYWDVQREWRSALADLAEEQATYVHVPQAVGPAPTVRPSTNTGTLVVTTERLTSNLDEEFPSYEPYEVFDSAGHLVKEVDNASGADVVELNAGRYALRVQALRRKIIGVDVQIEAGRVTEVHLDGDWQPDPPGTPQSLVVGPGGFPIGFRGAKATP
jgi:hypothetical protein